MRAHFNPVSLWMRGVLQDEYGVPARSLKLRTNQQEQVPGWKPPEWMEIERLPKGQKIEDVLPRGEIDACMLPEISPKHSRIPGVRRLWPNFREVEKRLLFAHEDLSDSPCRRGEEFNSRKTSMGGARVSSSLYQSQGDGHQARERHAAIFSCLVWRRTGRRDESCSAAMLGPTISKTIAHVLETMTRYAEMVGVTERKLEINDLFAESAVGRRITLDELRYMAIQSLGCHSGTTVTRSRQD